MNKKYLLSLFILSFCTFLSGCFPVRLIKVLNQRGDSTLEQKEFLTEIPFDYAGNFIVSKARFSPEGLKKRFLIDTGAPTVISEASFKENQFPTIYLLPDEVSTNQIDSASKSNILTIFPKLPELHLENLVFKDVASNVINKKGLEKYACFASDGIIGSNVMNDAIWQIDYSRKILTVTDDLKKLRNIEGATQVKFKDSGPDKKPIIPVVLNGETYWFLFDTGSSLGITLSPELIPFFGNIPSERISGFSLNGLRTVYTENDDKQFNGSFVNLPEFVIGGLKVKNATAMALELPFFEKRDFTKKQSGNLGNKFFQDYIVTINWKKNLIYFAPQPNPVQPIVTSNFGLLGRFNGQKKYVVQYLFKNSEAVKAGIKLNDEILAINGFQMDNLSPDQYCEFVNNPEKLTPEHLEVATFTVRHANGETKDHTFKRQPLFPEQISPTSRQ